MPITPLGTFLTDLATQFDSIYRDDMSRIEVRIVDALIAGTYGQLTADGEFKKNEKPSAAPTDGWGGLITRKTTMNLIDWFDPYNRDHVLAFKNRIDSGFWPRGFLPDGIEIPVHWDYALQDKLARCWVDHFLTDEH